MRQKHLKSFLKGLLLIQLFILSVAAGLTVDFHRGFVDFLPRLRIIKVSVPFSGIAINQHQAEWLLGETCLSMLGTEHFVDWGAEQMQTASIAENMIDSHMQVLAYATPVAAPVVEPALPQDVSSDQEAVPSREQEEKTVAEGLFRGKKVLIYCTHSAESYIPDSGKARLDGKRGLINKVAENLQKALVQQGLPAEFVNTIHDYPDYDQSYTNSRKTVKQILQTDKEILALFDVHRDSLPGTTKAPTITADGRKSARVLIIVGTDERKPHPEWKKNLAFAQALQAQGEKMYPGLIKGVTTKAGTYNQEFHSRALLLELGSDYNTLEEANYAAELFADVIIQVLKEEIQPQ